MPNLDFNSIKRPTLLLTMSDEEQTQIKVCAPSERLVEELTATALELEAVAKSGDKEAVACIYDLAARLINCNRSFITVTVDDLRNKFHLDLEALIVFFNAYLDFINEIANSKN